MSARTGSSSSRRSAILATPADDGLERVSELIGAELSLVELELHRRDIVEHVPLALASGRLAGVPGAVSTSGVDVEALGAALAHARAWAARLGVFSFDVARNDFFDMEGEHGPRLVDRGVPSPMLALYPPSAPGAFSKRVVFTGRPPNPFAMARPPNPAREATTDELVAWIERHVGAPAETGRDTAPADAAL